MLLPVNPPDHGRAGEGKGMVLPSELRGQKKTHLRLVILLKDGPGCTCDKGSPLRQVLGDTVYFFGCTAKSALNLVSHALWSDQIIVLKSPYYCSRNTVPITSNDTEA